MNKLNYPALVIGTSLLLSPLALADEGRGSIEKAYVRLVGVAPESGYGFCEFEHRGREVHARVWSTGALENSVITTWIFQDDEFVGQLDGTVSTRGGDSQLEGEFKIPGRPTVVTLDVRDHLVTIQGIGNTPDDPKADATLVTELTTPGPGEIGTCTIELDGSRGDDND